MRIREDGRVMRDFYLAQVKTPAEWGSFHVGGREVALAGRHFPVAAFDALLPHFARRWASNNERAQAALVAAIERIGRCIVVGHSQGGEHALVAALARPDLVAAYVGIEPSGFPEPAHRSVAARPFLFVLGDFLDATPLWTALVAKIDAYAARLVDWLRTAAPAADPPRNP